MKQHSDNSRREFLRKLIAGTSMMSIAPALGTLQSCTGKGSLKVLPMRPFGKTGEMVGIYSLGAQATVEQVGMRDRAIEIVNRCLDLGINYIDTSAWYGMDGNSSQGDHLRGISERHVGEVMRTRRKEVFLATKTHDRSYDGAMRHLESSLKNLQTDVIDLWQIHNIRGGGNEDIDRIFAEDGVIKAMEKAREEKTVRFLGITGHADPAPMKELIDRYPFDAVLMALNAADKHHNSYIEKLLPTAVEKEMGIIGMKIPSRDRIFSNGGIITMKEAMSYTLSLPVSTIIIGLDNLAELEENIKIAREFEPLTEDEMLAIEDKVKPHYEHLLFYKGLSDWPEEWSGNNVPE
ncbi:MAG: aldo/keto reductase [Bacteroidales bacterium]|nr:aldo/keto reductase [Bacteroidales bacterium]